MGRGGYPGEMGVHGKKERERGGVEPEQRETVRVGVSQLYNSKGYMYVICILGTTIYHAPLFTE